MTIPKFIVDNPLEDANLPDMRLETALPAEGMVAGILNWPIAWNVIAITALIQVGLSLLQMANMADRLPLLNLLLSQTPLILVGYCLVVLIRPAARDPIYSWLILFLAVIAGVATVASQRTVYQVTYVLAAWAMWMIEMGNHYVTIANESVAVSEANRKLNDARFEQLLVKGFTAILLVMILVPLLGLLVAAWVVALMNITFTYKRLSQMSRKPLRLLERRFSNFLFYPGPTAIRPGQIISPAGNLFSRAAMFGSVAGVFIAMGILEATRGQFMLAAAWILLSFVQALAVTMLVTTNVGSTIEIHDRPKAWHAIIRKMRESRNPVEKNALLMGYVAADSSPVIVDRSLCFQHFHCLGATGMNKTSMGLAPLIEQLVSFGDASVIIIDLKGDTPEMYQAADAAVRSFRPETTLQYFSLENLTKTHVFNPFLTPGWTNLSIQERSDVLCTCCGLAYGFEYGRSFFTSCNAAVMTAANLANPDALSFRQLNREIQRMLRGESGELLPELRRAGIHALEVIGRLACYDSLNVVSSDDLSAQPNPTGSVDEVLENRLELSRYFQEPRVGYFRLPSTTSSIGAPSIARLILYFLIVAGKSATRKTKVHVIIDEFQRTGTEGLDQILQLARSHNIGLILANQSMADLLANSPKVFHAVSGNCGVRQWFSVNSNADIKMVGELMGTREEVQVTRTRSTRESSYSYRTAEVPRARVTDLHTISENPNLSILQVSGSGRGYARYNGIPFVCYNDYHISAEEFELRKQLPWPHDLPGMITAQERHEIDNVTKPRRGNTRPKPRPDNDDLFGPLTDA